MGIIRGKAKFSDHLVRILDCKQHTTETVSGWVEKVKTYKKGVGNQCQYWQTRMGEELNEAKWSESQLT